MLLWCEEHLRREKVRRCWNGRRKQGEGYDDSRLLSRHPPSEFGLESTSQETAGYPLFFADLSCLVEGGSLTRSLLQLSLSFHHHSSLPTTTSTPSDPPTRLSTLTNPYPPAPLPSPLPAMATPQTSDLSALQHFLNEAQIDQGQQGPVVVDSTNDETAGMSFAQLFRFVFPSALPLEPPQAPSRTSTSPHSFFRLPPSRG